MYCLVLIISLAMAAPRVSRNCYTFCDLQKADPTNVIPQGCNCSLSGQMNAENASKEITLLDDTGVYFVPAEADLFKTQITPQPFLISNPVKFNSKMNRIKKGSEAKKDFSEELSEHIETYEKRKTFIRVTNNDESQPPSYLDLEIQDVASSETSVKQQSHFIPSFESTERALVECLDLHILDFTRKYGSGENFNEFWEARNLQIYEDLSNSDLNDKIKQYCSETEFIIEQSLQDIKRGVPKKKANFRYVHEDKDDISENHETKQSAQPFEFKSFSFLTESTSLHDGRTELPSVFHNSIENDLSEKHELHNSDSKYETTLEILSTPNSSHNTDPTADNIDESKSIDIYSNKAENTMSDVTTVTTKNTVKSYNTEFDMDTMPSEIIIKTIDIINKSDSDIATNTPILDKTTIFPISTTPLNDVLFLGDTSKKSLTEKQEEGPDELFKLATMPSGIILKINKEMNKSNDEIVRNEPISDEIFSASIIPLTEEQSIGDISASTERSNAEKEKRSNETIQFNFDTMPSGVILKPNNETNKSNIIMASNELSSDDISFLPASTTSKNDKLSFGDLSNNSETYMAEKQELEKDESKTLDLDQEKIPFEVFLKSNNEYTTSNINTASNEPILENITFFPASTTPQNEKLTLGDTSSNSKTSMTEKQGQGKQVGKELDLYMPAEVVLKLNNETNKTNINRSSNERNLDTVTFFPTSTTAKTVELSLGVTSTNTKTSMKEKEAEGKGDSVQLHFVTTPSKIILKPSNEIKPHLNAAGNEQTLEDIKFFPTASTLPKNEKVSLEIASGNSEQSTTELQEKHTDGDVDLDLNTMAPKTILNAHKIANTPDFNIDDSESILEDKFKFITTSQSPQNEKPFVNMHEETISRISSDEDTSVPYISTTPVNTVRSLRRSKFREDEVQIPKIITKECKNNEVQSFINGNEAIPNNDFEHSEAKTKSLQKNIKQVGSDDYSELNPISSVEDIDATAGFNNDYISGNLYFGSSQELVPVRLLQTDSGKVSLGIDGRSLCEKLLQKPNSKSLLLSTLCDCVQHKMTNNNSTDMS